MLPLRAQAPLSSPSWRVPPGRAGGGASHAGQPPRCRVHFKYNCLLIQPHCSPMPRPPTRSSPVPPRLLTPDSRPPFSKELPKPAKCCHARHSRASRLASRNPVSRPFTTEIDRFMAAKPANRAMPSRPWNRQKRQKTGLGEETGLLDGCREPGSNRRHTDFQSVALPTELPRQAGWRNRRDYKGRLAPSQACNSGAIRHRNFSAHSL